MHYCDSYKGDKYFYWVALHWNTEAWVSNVKYSYSVEMHIVLAIFFFNQFKVFGDFFYNEN